MRANAVIISLIILVGLILGGWYVKERGSFSGVEGKQCTTEAMICPDGSAVGRTGPNCEFAECPNTTNSQSQLDTSTWKTYRNEQFGFELRYLNTYVMYRAAYTGSEKRLEPATDQSIALAADPFSPNPVGIAIGVYKEKDPDYTFIKEKFLDIVRQGNSESFGGLNVYHTRPNRELQRDHGLIWIDRKSFIISIDYIYDTRYPDQSEEVEKILSTFKFTK